MIFMANIFLVEKKYSIKRDLNGRVYISSELKVLDNKDRNRNIDHWRKIIDNYLIRFDHLSRIDEFLNNINFDSNWKLYTKTNEQDCKK